MPLNSGSTWPLGIDTWPFIDPDQGLGTANEEGDLFLNKVANAIRQIQTQTGIALTPAVGSDRHGFEGNLIAYTPAAFGIGGLTAPSTWTGFYSRIGHRGHVYASGKVTGDWTGPAGTSYLELSLPTGWVAHPTVESTIGNAWVGLNPSFGGHFSMQPIIHPNANRARFISPNIVTISGQPVRVAGELACNGVQVPGQFTGDGTPANQDDIFVTIEMWVQ